jgi:hypothetical protein
MTEDLDDGLIWHRSTACADNACVEVAFSQDEVMMRNSERPESVTRHSREEWTAFLQGIAHGDFRH